MPSQTTHCHSPRPIPSLPEENYCFQLPLTCCSVSAAVHSYQSLPLPLSPYRPEIAPEPGALHTGLPEQVQAELVTVKKEPPELGAGVAVWLGHLALL